LIWWARTSENK